MAAITGAALGAATTLYATKKASDQAKDAKRQGQAAIEAADPYAPYRKDAAEKLNALMADPSSIKDTPEYKARQEAASRALAAQGYTGSGNAVLEAANQGGAAFQSAYDRLARLAGVDATPGGGYGTAMQNQQNADAQYLSGLAGVGNNLTNLVGTIGGKMNTGGAAQIGPVQRQPTRFDTPSFNVSVPDVDFGS